MLKKAGGAFAIATCSLASVAVAAKSMQTFPWSSKLEANHILKSPVWPERFPLTEEHLKRIDQTDDGVFYSQVRNAQP